MNSSHPLFKRIDHFIGKHDLILPNSTIILGLSGGPDSMFLLHYLAGLHKAGTINLIAAHLDHGWRTESAEDAQFCKNAAQSLRLRFEISTISELSMNFKKNGSKEETGRLARRYFFQQIQHTHSAHSIALAHHADDQQETFFIRLLRGAALTGLTSIKPRSGSYIHPLLCVSKNEILSFLHENKIDYRVDSTNSSPNFLRNRIRSYVVPALKKADTRFDTTFTNTLTRLQATEEFLEQHTEIVWKEIVQAHSNQLHLHIPAFLCAHTVLQHRLLLRWFIAEKIPFPPSQAFFNEVIRFLTGSQRNAHAVNASWRIVKKKSEMWIEKY